ncbi:MAG: YqjD family protein [Planctomycetota bacterium JB042]
MPNTRNGSRAKKNDPRQQFTDAASAARDNVRDMGGAAAGIAKEQVDHVVETATSVRDSVAEKVRRNPMPSLMIAAGAGLLAGVLLRRR